MVALEIGKAGHDALWVGFLGMFVPTLFFATLASREPVGKKYFHVVTSLITGVASLAYLTMASGYGSIIRGDGRQFFYARYIDWLITTPLLLLDLAGLAGSTPDVLMWLIGTDVLMIAAGLIGGLIDGKMKWAFWTFGMLTFFPIVTFLVTSLSSRAAGPDAATALKQVSSLTAITWAAYPIIWAIGEGASLISADVEAISYTILDVTAKSLFGFIIIGARSGINEALNREGPQDGTPSAQLLQANYGATVIEANELERS